MITNVILILYNCSINNNLIRGANLSPFGEIRRFHLEIGHSRESCRSVKKKIEGGGGGGDLRVIWVTSPAAFLSPVGNGRNGPALLCL